MCSEDDGARDAADDYEKYYSYIKNYERDEGAPSWKGSITQRPRKAPLTRLSHLRKGPQKGPKERELEPVI
jgi:hypothetical protein